MNRQWLLARRPSGQLADEDFRRVEAEIPEPRAGQVLVRASYLSCDPTQRGWMARDTYMPRIGLGEVIRGFAAGEVVRSLDPRFRPGQRVQGLWGWQDWAVFRPDDGIPAMEIPDGIDLATGMSLFGLTGMTAYFGLMEVGKPKAGETVVVSGAAGATGSVVAQIAKLVGCRTVGIAGGEAKCRYLKEDLGVDGAIDYKRENLITRLRELCPDGIDIFFDNVGGATLNAALLHLAVHGRIVICGAIATYNDDSPSEGPTQYLRLLLRRGRMEGFNFIDYAHRTDEATARLLDWYRTGRVKDRVDVSVGFDQAPEALRRLFRGDNQGKQLVQIADPSTGAPL